MVDVPGACSHARRTVGFFKVRGVNINHAELEDALFRDPDVVDFRAEVYERRRQRRPASARRNEDWRHTAASRR